MLRYLKGTTDHGIMFGRVNNATSEVLGWTQTLQLIWIRGDPLLVVFSHYIEEQWVGKHPCCQLLPFQQLRKSILLSVYIALIEAIKEAIWLKGLASEQLEQSSVTINYDSSSTIWLSKNLQNHERTKHIAIRFHFIRDEIGRGVVNVIRIATEINPANMLRKPLCHFFSS